jgi:predicted O-methyltransferase YrrM
MSRFTLPAVDAYIKDLLPTRDPVLAEMEALAARDHIPIVGPAVGTLLAQLSTLSDAKRVFELGSAIGYSTVWLARAVGPTGKVYYTDGDERNAKLADDFLTRAGLRDRVEIMVGDALKSFESVPGEFDVVFNDVDKEGYPDVYRKATPRVRVGGLFISDNVLWSARVVDPAETDDSTEAIRQFNRMLSQDDRFRTVILPLRDGVSIAQRLK